MCPNFSNRQGLGTKRLAKTVARNALTSASQFFAGRFAPRPCLLLKFGHMIDIAYIYHVSKFQQQTRSRNKTSGKKLLQETP